MSQRPYSPLSRLVDFLRVEAASGFVLLAAAAAALIWANSSASDSYQALWQLPLHFSVGRLRTDEPLRFWINDGLMTFFFLLVGLEIRRELHEGALSDLKQAALPAIAAFGGVLVPALIYTAFNANTSLWKGWAVPTATDIAFAVGVLALLGKRVPPALRVLLLAIAIIDDIVAILVIAFFYSHGLGIAGLLIAAAATTALAKLSRSVVLSVVLASAIWGGLLWAGVHPALAGVIAGLLTPVSKALRVEHGLHPWVAFGIMPLFALSNAGVNVGQLNLHANTTLPLVAGVVVGLVVGKPLGILSATVLAVRLNWCALPAGVRYKHVAVVGCLGGIGFTMAIFVSQLAFGDAANLMTAKVAILIGSTVAAIVGLMAGRVFLPKA